jgi:hypothetical protein
MKAFLLFSLAMTPAALAQQAAQPQQTPAEQALSQKLLREIGDSIQCNQEAIVLRQTLSNLQKEIEDLKKQVAVRQEPPHAKTN